MNQNSSPIVEVDGRSYVFSGNVIPKKLDAFDTYKKMSGENLACVDIAAIRDDVLYLIEVKDYGYTTAKMPQNLPETVTKKIYGALSVLSLLKYAEKDAQSQTLREEIEFGKSAFSCKQLVVVADIYTSSHSRSLVRNPRPQNLKPTPKAIKDKLRDKFKKLGIQVQVHIDGGQSCGGAVPFWKSSLVSAERTRRIN